MKARILLIALSLLCTVSAMAGSNIYEKYQDKKDVTIVNISETMLQLIPMEKLQGADVASMKDKLKSVLVFTSENKSVSKKIKKDLKKEAKSNNLSNLVSFTNRDKNVIVYAQNQGETISRIVVLVTSQKKGKDVRIIDVKGNFTTDDLNAIQKFVK